VIKLTVKEKAVVKAKSTEGDNKITRTMTLGEAVSRYPATAEVMMTYGLHCIGCHVAAWESIEDGARGHGLSDKQIDEMVKEMNKKVK
jgi:hybrid cluster-associated redox disulfide protein